MKGSKILPIINLALYGFIGGYEIRGWLLGGNISPLAFVIVWILFLISILLDVIE
jgi:hypothetical protein